MFGIFKKNVSEDGSLEKHTFKIIDMHCSSCAMNIDMTLEDMQGVNKSVTHYATGSAEVHYNPETVSVSELVDTIRSLGYTIEVID